MAPYGFSSALSYTKVRDFAYHDKHPLHYGVRDQPPTAPSPLLTASVNDGNDSTANSGLNHENRAPHTGNEDDIYRRAVSLFDFEPENENEARLKEGQILWISYRHGQGWLVAENLETGETGLVPEEYVQVLPENEGEWVDDA